MSIKNTNNSIDKRILEEAAGHYLSLQDDSMSGAELKAWQAWFMRSKEHQLAFRRLEALWGVLDGVSEADLAAMVGGHDAKPEAAGAGSVISLVAPTPKGKAKTLQTPQWFVGIAASFAAVLLAGYMVLAPEAVPGKPTATPYYTEAGEQRVVRLADGSIVELGADSGVSVAYSRSERTLKLLRGEAVFTVAKNPKRPFVVHAGNGSVTALGTVFNVQRTLGTVRVRVLEGTVAVRPKTEEQLENDGSVKASDASGKSVALVTAGSQTSYTGAGMLSAVETADFRTDLAWRTGVLTLVNQELSEVIREVNRYVQNEVAIGDNAVGDFRFTGTVYPDKIDEWLEGLEQGYPLKVVRVGGRTILLLDDTATSH